jgi:hypothetical protein
VKPRKKEAPITHNPWYGLNSKRDDTKYETLSWF